MPARLLYLALVLAGLSTGAHAGLNKCKGANGHYTYQNAPCPAPAGASARNLPTLAERNALVRQQKLEEKRQRYADDRPGANWDPGRTPGASMPPPPPPVQAQQPAVQAQSRPAAVPHAAPGGPSKSEYEQKMAAQKVEAENARVRAWNKSVECNHARQQLAVVRSEGRVHSVDNKGQRSYLADEQRDAVIADAQRRVNRACN